MLPEGGLFPDHILQGTGGSSNSFAFAVFGQPDFSQVGDDGRVLLAQFTVRAGEHVRGTVSRVAGFEDTGLPLLQPYARFGGVFVTPAPGALALFAFAALTGSRRRRSEE